METTAHNAPDRFLDAKEVAAILKMHEKTVRNKLKAGEIPGKQFGRSWRVSEQALYKMLPQS